MRPLQEIFPAHQAPDVLVGLGSADDAAVWRLGDGRVGVCTLDVFPPVVDDAGDFGAIAAANAMSDVWAMGADPILALNIALFPADMPLEIASAILVGAAEQVREAGAVIAGGHTMDNQDPIFGLAVIGQGDESALMTKGGMSTGQDLVLSKPLGTGLLTTAGKRGKLERSALTPAVAVMRRLNRDAARVGRAHGVGSATDITGFGLAGHALEMADLSGVGLELRFADLPFLPQVNHFAALGTFAGGAFRNRSHYLPRVTFDPALDEAQQNLLFDPQTSGGLLMAVSPDRSDALLADLRRTDPEAACIGRVVEGAGLQVIPG